MSVENWLPVPGYPGYEVSDMGQVRSYKINGSYKLAKFPHLLSPSLDRGYPGVLLCANGQSYFKKIHQLVALAFLGTRPEGMEVCHNDSDPGNNHLSNLRYDTHKANIQDAVKAGRAIGSPKLDNRQVEEVKKLYKEGVPVKEIARRYSVSKDTIYSIASGRTRRAPGQVFIPRSNFTNQRALQIRTEYATGQVTMEGLSKKYGVDLASISRIINGKLCIKAGGPIRGIDYEINRKTA